MKRKATKALAVAIAVGLALSACTATPSSTNPSEKVTLTFWDWVPGMQKAVDLWNKENPDIQVKHETVPSGGAGSGYTKLTAALKAGSGAPDLMEIEYNAMPQYVQENGLVNLKPLGVVDFSKFVPWQVKQSTFGNAIYGVPQASGPIGLYYRSDIFSSLGLKAPTTWDEYAADAKIIHDKNPSQYIATFAASDGYWFSSLAWQAGAKWFGLDGDTWTVSIDSPQTLKVAQYWDDLRTAGLVKTEPDFSNAWYSDLQTGNVASWPAGSWSGAILSANAPATAGKWRVAPIPQWGSTFTSANWGGATTAVIKGTKHAEAAAKFAYWLNSDPKSIDLLIAGGYGWPATKTGFTGSALDAPDPFFGGQNANADVFKPSNEAVDTSWQWSPTVALTMTHLQDGFQAAIEGKGTFVDAVKAAQTQTIADLKAQGLKARAG